MISRLLSEDIAVAPLLIVHRRSLDAFNLQTARPPPICKLLYPRSITSSSIVSYFTACSPDVVDYVACCAAMRDDSEPLVYDSEPFVSRQDERSEVTSSKVHVILSSTASVN